jgi:predicted RNase H-like HicB family nuclease
MDIRFTSQIFKERQTYVGYAPELDVSSCGETRRKAERNLMEAVRLFLEEAEKMGTLEQILEESGYVRRKAVLEGPKFVSVQRVSLPLPLLHAKT